MTKYLYGVLLEEYRSDQRNNYKECGGLRPKKPDLYSQFCCWVIDSLGKYVFLSVVLFLMPGNSNNKVILWHTAPRTTEKEQTITDI